MVQPVDLADHQGRSVQPGGGDCGFEGGTVRDLVALDFRELLDDGAASVLQVGGHCCPLRLQPSPLLPCFDAVDTR